MSDLDDDILGLAGSGSESEADDLDLLERREFGDRSPSQEAKESVEKAEEPQTSRKGVAQKVKSRGRRKRRQESEEEIGEASPRDESIGSGGGSDGEADAPGEDEDGYGEDGVFTSKADEDHIMSLPMLEREEILAERADRAERARQDKMLKQQLAQSTKIKRKAEEADLDYSSKRSTRPKTEKRSALDDYKRAREQKGVDRIKSEAARDRRDVDERSPSSASDRDADGESEVEWAEPSSTSRKDEPPAELRDFERCRVGRSNFAKVCFYPGFEDALKGCFARVSIGMNKETGQNMYRMTQIKGFTEGKPYQLELPNGKHFTTDQYAVVAQGPHERPWPFSACSDSRFMEGEFNRYTDAMRNSNIRIPSRKFLIARVDAINALVHTNFTEETLQLKFAKQRAMELKFDPVHAAKQKRKDIMKRRAEAEQNGDEEELTRCDNELEALENSSAAANGAAKLKSSPSKPQTNLDRIQALNQANRKKTQQEVRQALINERKKLLRDRELMAQKQAAEAEAKANGDAKSNGASALRQKQLQKAAMKDMFGETPDGSRAGTPLSGTGTPKKTGTPLVGAIKKGPVGALKQKSLDDDVIGGLDLDIDVEI